MEHMSDTLAPPATETTIAVLLGASEYPYKPAWSNPVLGASARAFRNYVLSATGLGLASEQVLDLFDAAAGPVDQMFQIKEFLETAGKRARDLLLYYVGHGGFDNDEYYLGIRSTRREHEFITTIESRKLARIIRDAFGYRRVYVILDSCFAGSAAADWQGDKIEVAVRKMSQPLPRQGTAFLAAASKHDVTRAPRAERYTMFTGAVIDVLTRGVDREQPRLSMYELYEEVRDRLQRRETDEEARPELHVPSQREGDVSRLWLFPNAAYHRIVAARQLRTEAKARAAAMAEDPAAHARAAARAEVEAAEGIAVPLRGGATGRAAAPESRVAVLRAPWVRLAISGAALAAITWTVYTIVRSGGTTSPTADAGGQRPAREAEPLANPWVRIDVPSSPILLGIDDDRAPATVRGFRPSRKISSPPTPYEIQQHEVTWSEFTPWHASNYSPVGSVEVPPSVGDSMRATLPVTGVTWTIALAYCRSLGGALPTEEQWEFAARGPKRRPNSWGADRLDPKLTHVYGGPKATPNEVNTSVQDETPDTGIHDLIGNVQEWALGLWREDLPGADESWVESGPTSIRAIRGLPLGVEPPSSMPVESAAYREQLCATGPCVEKGAELRRYVGFRCARAAAPR